MSTVGAGQIGWIRTDVREIPDLCRRVELEVILGASNIPVKFTLAQAPQDYVAALKRKIGLLKPPFTGDAAYQPQNTCLFANNKDRTAAWVEFFIPQDMSDDQVDRQLPRSHWRRVAKSQFVRDGDIFRPKSSKYSAPGALHLTQGPVQMTDPNSTPGPSRTRSGLVLKTSRAVSSTRQESSLSSSHAPAQQASPALLHAADNGHDQSSLHETDTENGDASRKASEQPSETSSDEMNLSKGNHHFPGSEERRLSSPSLPVGVPSPEVDEPALARSATPVVSVSSTSMRQSNSSYPSATSANNVVIAETSPLASPPPQPAAVSTLVQPAPSIVETADDHSTIPKSGTGQDDDEELRQRRPARRRPTPWRIIFNNMLPTVICILVAMLVFPSISRMNFGLRTRIPGGVAVAFVRRYGTKGFAWATSHVIESGMHRNDLYPILRTRFMLYLGLVLLLRFMVPTRPRHLHIIRTRIAAFLSRTGLSLGTGRGMRLHGLLRWRHRRAIWLILFSGSVLVLGLFVFLAAKGTSIGLSGSGQALPSNGLALELELPPVPELQHPPVPEIPALSSLLWTSSGIASYGCIVTSEGCPYPGVEYSTREHSLIFEFPEPVFIHQVWLTVYHDYLNLLESGPEFLVLEFWGMPMLDGEYVGAGVMVQDYNKALWMKLCTEYLPMAPGTTDIIRIRWDVDETPQEWRWKEIGFQGQDKKWLLINIQSIEVVGWADERDERDEMDDSVGAIVGDDELGGQT